MNSKNETKNEKRHCCQIDCKENATHSIWYSKGIEDYTDMCKKHIAEHLPDDKEVTVTPIINKE